MKYDITAFLDKINLLSQANDNRAAELEQESMATSEQLTELKAAMTEAMTAEALGEKPATPMAQLKKKSEDLKDKLAQITDMLPIIKEAKRNSLVKAARELGHHFNEVLRGQMLTDVEAQQQLIVQKKAQYLQEVKRLYELEEEQKAVYYRIGHAFHMAGLSEEAPPRLPAVELHFRNGWNPRADLPGVTEKEVYEAIRGNVDKKLLDTLKQS